MDWRKPSVQRQMRGMECVLPSRGCHSPLLSSAIRSQSRVTVGPPVETDPAGENAVMLRSRPLAGDNGSTHLLSDVYYIQVHLSFRGSWPRVTPRAIKPDCGPNITGTGSPRAADTKKQNRRAMVHKAWGIMNNLLGQRGPPLGSSRGQNRRGSGNWGKLVKTKMV